MQNSFYGTKLLAPIPKIRIQQIALHIIFFGNKNSAHTLHKSVLGLNYIVFCKDERIHLCRGYAECLSRRLAPRSETEVQKDMMFLPHPPLSGELRPCLEDKIVPIERLFDILGERSG